MSTHARTELKTRTIDEIAHETAASIMPELTPGHRVGVVIVSEVTGKSGTAAVRTAWRFIHCTDPALQAQSLREIADIIEAEARRPPG